MSDYIAALRAGAGAPTGAPLVTVPTTRPTLTRPVVPTIPTTMVAAGPGAAPIDFTGALAGGLGAGAPAVAPDPFVSKCTPLEMKFDVLGKGVILVIVDF